VNKIATEFKLEVTDHRKMSLVKFDPDTATASETWITSFLTDLEARYRGHGVRAVIKLEIELRDPGA